MSNTNKKVSMAVIRRLPRYYQYLNRLQKKGIQKISSTELARMMGLTASQIRQDLNSFGAYGQQGYGYNVVDLRFEIQNLLGLSENYNCIIVGAGHLGHAVSHYERFAREGIYITAMFDVDTELVGKNVGHLPVYHVDDMGKYVKKHKVDIAILCVPADVAQGISNLLVGCGVKAILNFSAFDLNVPEDIFVENINIIDSMFTLTYRIGEKKRHIEEDLNESMFEEEEDVTTLF